mgnify:CR=1 FL=1
MARRSEVIELAADLNVENITGLDKLQKMLDKLPKFDARKAGLEVTGGAKSYTQFLQQQRVAGYGMAQANSDLASLAREMTARNVKDPISGVTQRTYGTLSRQQKNVIQNIGATYDDIIADARSKILEKRREDKSLNRASESELNRRNALERQINYAEKWLKDNPNAPANARRLMAARGSTLAGYAIGQQSEFLDTKNMQNLSQMKDTFDSIKKNTEATSVNTGKNGWLSTILEVGALNRVGGWASSSNGATMAVNDLLQGGYGFGSQIAKTATSAFTTAVGATIAAVTGVAYVGMKVANANQQDALNTWQAMQYGNFANSNYQSLASKTGLATKEQLFQESQKAAGFEGRAAFGAVSESEYTGLSMLPNYWNAMMAGLSENERMKALKSDISTLPPSYAMQAMNMAGIPDNFRAYVNSSAFKEISANKTIDRQEEFDRSVAERGTQAYFNKEERNYWLGRFRRNSTLLGANETSGFGLLAPLVNALSGYGWNGTAGVMGNDKNNGDINLTVNVDGEQRAKIQATKEDAVNRNFIFTAGAQ